MCQFFLICPSDKRGAAREKIDPKTQGPTNVSKIQKDMLDLSQKMFMLLSEIMKPKVFENLARSSKLGESIKVA